MDNIMNNPRFADAFGQLASVRLNPRRHTAADALEHSGAVADHAGKLARANGCSEPHARLLEDLGRAHDVGKITGTARPERSLEVLRACGLEHAELLALVKWHDTSLPWFLASTKGQPPSEKAWRRLASEVDVRLLSLFMVADRVDAPPGWRRNAPTVWFLAQARERGLIADLRFDLPDQPSEIAAGGVVVRERDGAREVLLVRAGEGFELPAGPIEWDELPSDAAVREARTLAGIESPLQSSGELGHVDGVVGEGADRHVKRVRYFLLTSAGPVVLGAPIDPARERRWTRIDDARAAAADEALVSVLAAAMESHVGP